MLLSTACYGQTQTSPPGIVREARTSAAGQAKIRKAPGANRYAHISGGLHDKAGNLWFAATAQGVYRYDGKFFTNFTTKDGLSSNTISTMMEDRAGNLWFGTTNGVICCYDGQKFTSILTLRTIGSTPFTGTFLTKNPSRENSVNSLMQDKNGTIWLGTYDGVYCYNGTTITRFLDDKRIINKQGLRLNYIQSIVEDKTGSIWFASWFEGVCRYDGTAITNFKPNGEVWFGALLADRNGAIWAGRRGRGVCRYDGKTFTNVVQKGLFDSCCVNAMLQDRKGTTWFATEADALSDREKKGGLWRYDGKTFKNFTTKDGLPHNSVWCLVEDKAGNLWVGTRNNGLCRYDGKTFTSFSE